MYELNSGFFNSFAVPVQGYLWVGTSVSGLPGDTPAAEIYRNLRHAWTRLSKAVPAAPEIATLSGFDTVHVLEKIISHSNRTDNYKHLLRRMQSCQFTWQPLVDCIVVRGGCRLPKRYRLIIDDDSKVMREEFMKMLVDQVGAGSVLVMNPDTGAFCRENPVPSASLAARFGMGQGTAPLPGPVKAQVKNFGRGKVIRLAEPFDWSSPGADRFLLFLAETAKVERPVVTVPGVRAFVSKRDGSFFLPVFNESSARTVAAAMTLPRLPAGRHRLRRVSNGGAEEGIVGNGGFRLLLTPHELRVYELIPVDSRQIRPRK